MKTNVEILGEVYIESARFMSKLKEAMVEQSAPNKSYGNRAYAAAKRSALDLKRELTKLTQDTKYKYGS